MEKKTWQEIKKLFIENLKFFENFFGGSWRTKTGQRVSGGNKPCWGMREMSGFEKWGWCEVEIQAEKDFQRCWNSLGLGISNQFHQSLL